MNIFERLQHKKSLFSYEKDNHYQWTVTYHFIKEHLNKGQVSSKKRAETYIAVWLVMDRTFKATNFRQVGKEDRGFILLVVPPVKTSLSIWTTWSTAYLTAFQACWPWVATLQQAIRVVHVQDQKEDLVASLNNNNSPKKTTVHVLPTRSHWNRVHEAVLCDTDRNSKDICNWTPTTTWAGQQCQSEATGTSGDHRLRQRRLVDRNVCLCLSIIML